MVTLQCGAGRWRCGWAILWLLVFLPATVLAQPALPEWSPERFPTLTDGEEFQFVPSLEEAEARLEEFRERASTEGPIVMDAFEPLRFEEMFYTGPDESRDTIALTLVDPETEVEHHLTELLGDIKFTEELHCVARHYAHANRIGRDFPISILRYRPFLRCGLLAEQSLEHQAIALSDTQVEACVEAGLPGTENLLACALHHGEAWNEAFLERPIPFRLGVGQLSGNGWHYLSIVGGRQMAPIEPLDRILGPDETRMAIRTQPESGGFAGVTTSTEHGSMQLCSRDDADNEEAWTCSVPHEVDEVGIDFCWRTELRWMPVMSTQVYRTPPPLVPPEIPSCVEPATLVEVNARDLIEWTNDARAVAGLPPLLVAEGMMEWVELVRRYEWDFSVRNRLIGSGLGFDGLIAADFQLSPRLYSDQPCREWHAIIHHAPELRSALLSPTATHVALAAGPTFENWGSVSTLITVIEADSPQYQSAVERGIALGLDSTHRRALRRGGPLRRTVDDILDEMVARVQNHGDAMDDLVDGAMAQLRVLARQGGPLISVIDEQIGAAWTAAPPPLPFPRDAGVSYRVTRRPMHRVNRVVYRALYAAFLQ